MTLPQPESSPSPIALHRHDLEAIRVDGRTVRVQLETRALPDRSWRGQLRFQPEASLQQFLTADIFRGSSDADLLAAARGLREHHIRDLFRSLQPEVP